MATITIQNFSLFLVCLSFLVIIPRLHAHIAEFDDFWKERRLQALKNLNDSYHPNPEEVTRHFNEHVGRTLKEMESNSTEMESNSTRRSLDRKDFNVPCEATNPIDQCWRCDPNWEKNRKRLADCVLGFGRGTTGGKKGEIYVVTNCADDVLDPKPGTLRHAVTQNRPLWIIFGRSMVIELKEELIMTCDKTIDGRGVNVHITNGAGITVQFVKNIIIHGIHIHDIVPRKGGIIKDGENHHGLRTRSDGDGINLFGATNVWLDHLSMYKCTDGIIDAIQGCTAITISNCHFTDHNDVMLFGGHDDCQLDAKMQVTVAFNNFGKKLVQRMPRIRFGFAHVVNNDYTHWIMYALGGGQNPTIISQGNRFRAPLNIASKEVCKRECDPSEWKKWTWRSEGDLLLNGAIFTQSGDPKCSKKYGADLMVPYKPAYKVPILVKWSGTLRCEPSKPC